MKKILLCSLVLILLAVGCSSSDDSSSDGQSTAQESFEQDTNEDRQNDNADAIARQEAIENAEEIFSDDHSDWYDQVDQSINSDELIREAVTEFNAAGGDFSPEKLKGKFGDCEQIDIVALNETLGKEFSIQSDYIDLATNKPRYNSCWVKPPGEGKSKGSLTLYFAPDLKGTELQDGKDFAGNDMILDNWYFDSNDISDMRFIENLGDQASWKTFKFPVGQFTTLRVQQGGTESMAIATFGRDEEQVPVASLIRIVSQANAEVGS